MFNAVLVSLSDGQSYENAKVLQEPDFDKYLLPELFEEYTGCIFVDGNAILLHHWNFKIIQISKQRLTGPNCLSASRCVLSNELIYQDVKIIPQANWESLNIPSFFIKRNGESGQFAFSNSDGTYITADTNIASLIIPDPRKNGITKSFAKTGMSKSSFLGNIAE